MTKAEVQKLIEQWSVTGRPYKYDTTFIKSFIDWLYKQGTKQIKRYSIVDTFQQPHDVDEFYKD